MNLDELKSIIHAGESKHLEFKTSTAALKQVVIDLKPPDAISLVLVV